MQLHLKAHVRTVWCTAIWAAIGALWGCSQADEAPTKPERTAEVTYTEARAVCSHRSVDRIALFGDLHVHGAFSFDARNYGTVVTPEEVYRFGRGEPVDLAPLDANGKGTREVRIDRPLDFLSLTEHGEFLGEVALCTTPGSPGYDTKTCQGYRNPEKNGAFDFGFILASKSPERPVDLCGADGKGCEAQAAARWKAMQDAAEATYDRSAACAFTSIIGYEYTNTFSVSNLHRNVFFRNKHVPVRPITHMEQPTFWGLWKALDAQCNNAETGCEVLTIAHNSNLSNGKYFYADYPGAETFEAQREMARLRARMEPLVEIFQHKGDSECRNGLPGLHGEPDPLCDNEKVWPKDAKVCGSEPGNGGMRLWGCVHRLDFVRNALKEGLVESVRMGVNPYMLGIMASTDTHNGTPGHVHSVGFPGHVGVVDDTADKRLGAGNVTHDGVINNPGGLTGVWAMENSRDAIFEALRRREVFGTSGPRIQPRFFGGWGYSSGLCGAPDKLAGHGYDGGVPMGDVLAKRPAGGTPSFVVQATADAGTKQAPGARLERIQVIKLWVNAKGLAHEKVYEVAGKAVALESVDVKTCTPSGLGQDSLCAVWQDPDFEAGEPAVYYVRVLEVPTCRWSTLRCLELAANKKIAGCKDPNVMPVIRERAWTSPIWYRP